jgi:hypothetical protein
VNCPPRVTKFKKIIEAGIVTCKKDVEEGITITSFLWNHKYGR